MSATVTVPGYTLAGVAGIGGSGAVLRGTDIDGQPVAIRLLEEAPAGLLTRARTAAGVRHDGLAAVRELVPLPGGPAVVQDFVEGPTLATLRTARRGLSAAECAQLAGELLAGLAVLHAAGLIHGDVSPANVIVTPTQADQGRTVLVDLVGGTAADRGTRGFRAPEVDAGAALGTAADVYSAAQLSLWAAEPGARAEVRALLAPLLERDPGQRPSAQSAQQLLDGGAPVAIGLAPAEALASATLREHAAREPTTRARARRSRPRRRHRARRRRWVVRAAVLASLLVAVLAASTWTQVSEHLLTGPGKASGGILSTPAAEAAATVRDLLARRDGALTAGDAVALAEVTVPGSPLAASDAALLTDLTETEIQLRGYRTAVVELTALSAETHTATVQASLYQAAHERVTPDGTVTPVPEQPVQCLQLTLDRSGVDLPWRARTATTC